MSQPFINFPALDRCPAVGLKEYNLKYAKYISKRNLLLLRISLGGASEEIF